MHTYHLLSASRQRTFRLAPRLLKVALAVFVAATFITPPQGAAQRNNSSPIYAWAGMNNSFLHTTSSGSQYWVETEGGSTANGFWGQAEMIDMAVDAYIWAETYDSSNLATYKNEILNLANGFRGLHGDSWSSDNYNDDLDVAIIAFARGYSVTGSGIMLSDAETNFATVWGRAQQGNGGLCQNVALGCYENSSVNWTFVIAANILNQLTSDSTYKTDATGVYHWAKANLYNSSTGQIYDGPVEPADWSYNYGYAIGAGVYQGSTDLVPNVANYLMNDLDSNGDTTPYAGTYNGYNVLPNYGQGANDNDGGFNGVTMRWVGFAIAHSYLDSTVIAWAKANADSAWANRNGVELMWNDWAASTPTSGLYSWDCSSGAVALFDIPID